MTPEYTPMDPALEQAVSEIRDEAIDSAVIEAAAARVWERLAKQAADLPIDHIRNCADFRALIPEYRAGRLPEARAMLLQDHLHQCVACRHVFEGKVVTMPAARPARRTAYTGRWVVAAAVLAAAGVAVWIGVDRFGVATGRAYVQTVTGTLWEVSPSGLQPLVEDEALPDGVEIRTARDSDAMLQLRDGSVVELRERSGFSTTAAGRDLTVRLGHGSIIVAAAKRRFGHLYVDTADCRVAVTGTIFGVTAGVKGSRVSVIQGEVRVIQDNQEKVLHPGDQTVTSPTVEPLAVKDDVSWSRNRDRLLQQLGALRAGIEQLHLPELRYSSRLLGRLPASTYYYASIPNLAQYFGEAQSVFHQQMAANPQLGSLWAGHGLDIDAVMEKVRTASEYLGDEIAVVGFKGAKEPVFFAETKRDGFREFLKQEGLPVSVETRPGVVAFSPNRADVETFAASLDTSSGFEATPFYARIAESYRDGAGLLLCADLANAAPNQPLKGVHYLVAAQKEVNGRMQVGASLGFDETRTGIAAWLAEPSPMGSLDYISPEATLVAAFVVKNPGAIVDQVTGLWEGSQAGADKALADARDRTGSDVRDDLIRTLGGEFALAVDGALMPVPSLKLAAEVYDPGRFEATLQKLVAVHNQDVAKSGGKPLRSSQETVEGRTYYMVGTADMNPITEVHYTFSDGYVIAAPTRALVASALKLRTAGTSIKRSARFLELTPPDRHVNFSAVIYQNMGSTLAPVAGLLGAFMHPRPGQPNPLDSMTNMKPSLIAVYGEPDRITAATNGNVLGMSLSNLMSGNVLGMAGIPVNFAQRQGTHAARMP